MKDDWMKIFWKTCYNVWTVLAIIGVVLFFVFLIAGLFVPRIGIPYWWR